MRDVDRNARLVLTYGGMSWLAGNVNSSVSRKDLFLVMRKDVGKTAFKKALKNTRWQKECVARMVEAGLLREIKKGSQVFYKVHNEQLLKDAVADSDNNGGMALARYLFPHEVGVDEEDIPDELREMLQEEGVSQGVLVPESREEAPKSLAEKMRAASAKGDSLFDGIKEVDVRGPSFTGEELTEPTIQKGIAKNEELIDMLRRFQGYVEHISGTFDTINSNLTLAEQRFSSVDTRLKALGKTLDRHVSVTENAVKEEAENRRKDATELLEMFTIIGENQVRGTKLVGVLNENVKKLTEGTSKESEVTAKVVQAIHAELKSVADSYRALVESQTGEGRMKEAMDLIKRGLRDFEEGQSLLLEQQAEQGGDGE